MNVRHIYYTTYGHAQQYKFPIHHPTEGTASLARLKLLLANETNPLTRKLKEKLRVSAHGRINIQGRV